jgi:type IV conjugative transfer system lipoprotein TraV
MLILLVTACNSNVNSSWDCPYQKGGSCASITANANRAMKEEPKALEDNKAAPLNIIKKENTAKADGINRHKVKLINHNDHNNYRAGSVDIIDKIDVSKHKDDKNYDYLRKTETVSRIWFSSFIDENDNLHAESYVYFVDEKSMWGSNAQ